MLCFLDSLKSWGGGGEIMTDFHVGELLLESAAFLCRLRLWIGFWSVSLT